MLDNRIPQFRNRKHWTPRYVRDRLALMWCDLLHPDWPMLTKDAVLWLDKHLTKDMVGVEFGGGRSTLWLAKILRRLGSVEYNPKWIRKAYNVTNVLSNYYPAEIPALIDNSIDFALIDGEQRDECAPAIIDKLKPGGILVVDDVERYWDATGAWVPFFEQVRSWRLIHTTNGIRDTAIWVRPAEPLGGAGRP